MQLLLQSQEYTMQKSHTDAAAKYPIIVSFPQGVPPDTEDLCIEVRRQERGKYSKQVVSVTGPEVRLSACDFGEFSREKNTSNFAIGVWDEKTGQLSLHPTDHVYALRTVYLEENSISELSKPENAIIRRKTLTTEFGSKKKKRAMQAAESNTILVENISGASAIESLLVNQSTGINQDLVESAATALTKSATKRGRRH
mmetsp:Transcript_2689/g.3684  ORF Transcript_2689/g.3684 Transcript_2689/m.3684 type:complete len:199 (+) Transcript_2689:1-597(+)